MKPGFSLSALACLCLAAGCGPDRLSDYPFTFLPLEPGLYRSDYEGRRGLRVFEAHPEHLSLAFDTALAAVYLAWKGPGDQLVKGVEGILYFRQSANPVWTVRRGGESLRPAVRFRSMALTGGSLEAVYDLALPDDTIAVRQFFVHDDHYGDHALESGFQFTGIDSGSAVVLQLGGAEAGQWPLLWSASSGRLEGEGGHEAYVQEFDGVGSFKVTFIGSASF